MLRRLSREGSDVERDNVGGDLVAKRYDLAIIGTGTAAIVTAHRVRAAGWSVAVADFRPFGGTCALRGCDPKKMMVGGAEAADHAWRMSGRGIEGDATLDWTGLMAFKRSFTDPVPQKREKAFADKGIHAFHGHVRFIGPNALEFGGERIEADRIVIAAGAGVGVLTGLFGVGGGFLIVPALTLLLGLSAAEAIATSLVIVTITSLAGLSAHAADAASVDYGVIAVFAGAALLASLAAGRVANQLPAAALRRGFAYLILAVAVGVAAAALLAPAALSSG